MVGREEQQAGKAKHRKSWKQEKLETGKAGNGKRLPCRLLFLLFAFPAFCFPYFLLFQFLAFPVFL